jgi:hypothetical protein
VLCDYFVARDDQHANLVLDADIRWGGTDQPGRSEDFGPIIDGKNIDPVVLIPMLHQALTQHDAPEGSSVLPPVDDDVEAVVVRLSDELTRTLADATEEQRVRATTAWITADEFAQQGGWNLAGATDFVDRLAMLALLARTESSHLYCLMSP